MCIMYGPTYKPMNYSSVSLYSARSVKYTQQSNIGFYISHLFHIKLFTVHVGYLFFINHPYLKPNEYTVISTSLSSHSTLAVAYKSNLLLSSMSSKV